MRDKDDKYIWKNLVESTQDYRTATVTDDLYILEYRITLDFIGRSRADWRNDWESYIRVFNGEELLEYLQRQFANDDLELDTILNPPNKDYIGAYRVKKIFDKGTMVEQDYYVEVPSSSLMISGQEMERFLDFSSSTRAKNALRRLR